MKQALLYALFAATLTTSAAHADTVTFTINPSSGSATPNETATYNATISAPVTNLAPVFLNGDTITLGDPAAGISSDDSGLFGNFPAFLNPGDSDTAPLFTLNVPTGELPGSYLGAYVLQGGADGNAQNTLGTEPFKLNVTAGAPSSVTPEPPSVLLLSTGVLGILALSLRKRVIAAKQI